MQPTGGCILFDPQYHSIKPRARGGDWDQGKDGIQEIVELHTCSDYCRKLFLPSLIPTRPKPRPLLKKDSQKPEGEGAGKVIDGNNHSSGKFVSYFKVT
jgi:hypothetical protein